MRARPVINAKMKLFDYLSGNCHASTGKGGSVIGMRRVGGWRDSDYIVRCCGYLFNVDEKVYGSIPWRNGEE